MTTSKKREKKAAAVTEPAARTAPFFRLMSLELLQPNSYNARRFEENMTPQRRARFEELVSSVREKGILEPLLVRLVPGDDVMFEVVAGERRYRAGKQVAEELRAAAPRSGSLPPPPIEYMVPCMIHDLDADEAFDLMLVENLQREDLSPFETATAFRDYLEKHGNTPDAVAELSARTGIPSHAIRRQVRIVNLPQEIRDAWREGKITQSHAEHFTRLEDVSQSLELLEVCLRGKLTVRELAERIGALAVDLDKGFFDQTECQLCHCNTSVQSGLFADLTPAGKCGNAACFEDKQGDFLGENWHKSKAHEKYGTNTFRFGHRLDVAAETIAQETAERCRTCDAFASIVRLTGAVVSGYDRTCIGPRACFEEMYCQPSPALDQAVDSSDTSHPSRPSNDSPSASWSKSNETPEHHFDPGPDSDETETDKDETEAVDGETKEEIAGLANRLAEQRQKKELDASPPPPPVEETAPVFNLQRGERFRKEFVKAQLPQAVAHRAHSFGHQLRLALAALAISGLAARMHIGAKLGHGGNNKIDKLIKKIFEIPINEVLEELLEAAAAQVMGDFTLMPAVCEEIACRFGVDVNEWTLTDSYLTSLTKSEIVRIGEELDIWKEEPVESWRQEHYPGKALLALEKTQLIDCILNSGADLAGRVPAEVLGKK